jgi:hypothetical protein
MPIWLRRFTFKNLKSHFEEIDKNHKKAAKSQKQAFGPNISPSYSSKRSKK